MFGVSTGNGDSPPSQQPTQAGHAKAGVPHHRCAKPPAKPNPLEAIKCAKTFEERCAAIEAAMKEGITIDFLRDYIDSL